MSTHTTSQPMHAEPRESATAHRIGLLAVVLAIASVTAVVGGLLWLEPSSGGETYAYADIADQRELWWGLLTGLAVVGILGTTLQAVATLYLVRRRGSTWTTIGADLRVRPSLGDDSPRKLVARHSAYFFPTDPGMVRLPPRHLFGITEGPRIGRPHMPLAGSL